MKKIIPVIITNDIKDLRGKLKKLDNLTEWVQIDIMDGRFVNNTSVELKDLSQISTDFNFEAHLMVLEPETYLQGAQESNIKRVIFHVEAVDDVGGVIEKIKTYGFETGIALNPETELEKVLPYKDMVDLILFLGVKPGFGGQEFNTRVLNKIKILKKLYPKLKIEVDGGVNLDNIKDIAQAGADCLVVGSDLFNAPDIKKRYQQLQQQIG